MILLWGRSDDAPLAMLRGELARRDMLFVHIDEEQVRTMRYVPTDRPEQGCIVMDHTIIDLADVSAFYLRPDSRYVVINDAEELQRRQFFQYALCAWADITPALVINRPAAMWSNQSKPFQARAAMEAGFKVPATLITTEPDALRDFLHTHGRVIYKSMSSIRSIVAELRADDPRIDEVSQAPVHVQEHVDGVDHRVHVVGDQVFACRVTSQAADYRYDREAGLDAVELPDAVRGRCIALARLLGLTFTGIDLRRTNKGEWVCFEANPSPGYSYYQDHAGLPIAQAVADLFSAAEKSSAQPLDRKKHLQPN